MNWLTLEDFAKAHAFADANKRTAYVSALVFVSVNGVDLSLPPNILALADATVAAVKDEVSKADLAALMRSMPRCPR